MEKCTRCGQCCVSNNANCGCGDATLIQLCNGQIIQLCSHFKLKNGIATCKLKQDGTLPINPFCTAIDKKKSCDMAAVEEHLSKCIME